jgi:small subunit ribosomal protein S20
VQKSAPGAFLLRLFPLSAALRHAREARFGRITPVVNPGLSGLPASSNRFEDLKREINAMANSPQAKKRARQNEARFQVNKARRSRIRTYLRRVEEAIASGDQTAAATALREAQPELMRGVTKGVLHQNTASRKMSRLSARVKALST